MSPWHPRLMFRSPKALPGRSLSELGFLVPSKLPQGSSEPRDSAPSERGPPAWVTPGLLRSLSKPQTPHFATSKRVCRSAARHGRKWSGMLESRRITLLVPVVRGEAIGAARQRGRGARKLLLPPGRGKAGMGVERRHSTGQVSTPSPALPLPGGGSQNLGRAAFGAWAAFHSAKRFATREVS